MLGLFGRWPVASTIQHSLDRCSLGFSPSSGFDLRLGRCGLRLWLRLWYSNDRHICMAIISVEDIARKRARAEYVAVASTRETSIAFRVISARVIVTLEPAPKYTLSSCGICCERARATLRARVRPGAVGYGPVAGHRPRCPGGEPIAAREWQRRGGWDNH